MRFRVYLLLPVLCLAAASPAAQPPDAAEQQYRSGTGLLNRGMHDLAAQEYQHLLADHPDHPRANLAHYGLAVCLTKLGKYEQAAAELDKVLSLKDFEFAADSILLRADCCTHLGDNTAAATWYSRFLSQQTTDPRCDSITVQLAELQYNAANLPAARETLDNFETRWPQSQSRSRATYLLALCDLADGHIPQAAEKLRVVRADTSAPELSQRATLMEAQCRHRMGETDAASELYRSAAASTDPAIQAPAILGQAQVSRLQAKPAQALSQLDSLRDRFPDVAAQFPVGLEHACALYDLHRFEESLLALDALKTSTSPAESGEVLYWKARCQLGLGHAKPAAQLFAQAAQQLPQDDRIPAILLERASALVQAASPDEALEAYSALEKQFPAHAHRAATSLTRAGLLYQLGRHAESLALAREFLDSSPAPAQACDATLIAAQCQYALRQFEDAQRRFAELSQGCPDHPQATRARICEGLCLVQLQKPDQARQLLEQNVASADPLLAIAAHTTLGDLAFAGSDWTAAATWFKLALKQLDAQPPSAQSDRDLCLLKLAICTDRAGAPREAVPLYTQLIDNAAALEIRTQAAFERSQAQVSLDELDAAAKGFESVVRAEQPLEVKKFTAHALRHLAAIASRQGRTDDAASFLGKIASSSSSDAAQEALLDQGIMLLSAGRTQDALTPLAQFLKSSPDHARSPEAAAYHAIALARSGDAEKSLPEFERISPRGTSLPPRLAATTAYEYAAALRQAGRDDDARIAFARVLTQSPPADIAAQSSLDLAQLSAGKGSHDEALRVLQAADFAAAAPEVRERSAYLVGACHAKLAHTAEAAAALRAFLSEYPSSSLAPSAGLMLGETLLARAAPADAVQVLTTVTRQPASKQIRAAALLRLGEAAAAMQDWPASESAFATYLREFPDNELWFQARFGIGWARENAGQLTPAMDAYREVVSRHQGPTAARAQFQIGECLFGQKKHDDAVRELLKVDILYSDPQWSPAALFEAGRCLHEINKNTESLAQLQEVIKRFPDSPWATQASQLAASIKPDALPGRPKDVPSSGRTGSNDRSGPSTK